MSDINLSSVLRNLSDNYYNQILSRGEYLQERKKILDKIDEEYNGRTIEVKTDADDTEDPGLMQTVSFMRDETFEDS